MNWSDLANIVGTAAPVIGTLIGGPAGAAVGALVASALGVENSPGAVQTALDRDPAALVRIKELELSHAAELQRLAVQAEGNRLAAETSAIQSVNVTMQAEAASIDPWSRRWRPFIGFIFGGSYGVTVLAVAVGFLVLAFTDPAGALIQLPGFVAAMTALFGPPAAILGVSAWHRGKMQVEAVKTKTP